MGKDEEIEICSLRRAARLFGPNIKTDKKNSRPGVVFSVFDVCFLIRRWTFDV
jgi:hypothetical protein